MSGTLSILRHIPAKEFDSKMFTDSKAPCVLEFILSSNWSSSSDFVTIKKDMETGKVYINSVRDVSYYWNWVEVNPEEVTPNQIMKFFYGYILFSFKASTYKKESLTSIDVGNYFDKPLSCLIELNVCPRIVVTEI